jgi:predicted RNA polymerase sigma factor
MRLTYLLIENEQTNKPFANALLSIMCFQSSRFDVRLNQNGETILQLYNQLLLIEYSPIAALNRTYALAQSKREKGSDH